ncbi:hypothetical protein [Motilimonas pumila]|uniref:Uncharacterized protein n=1 Tax=Motilimonas pumila TaxID=2303987 RepID=A0A418YEJ5_9GAMM|nr:hypothetical protein [Motilimonas pumila]RJG47583.1 hypothetical protein D1Z90_10635 [Motilimonas pumila]
MIDLLIHVNQWHWLSFALLMMLLELARLKALAFCVGLAAFCVGGTMRFEPMAWPQQWLLFTLCLVALMFIRHMVMKIKHPQSDNQKKAP